MEFKKEELIKSPLNYTGGKFDLLPQILPLFPDKINTFVDLFCGGCNVGINVKADKIIFNDIRSPLIDMYKAYKKEVEDFGVEDTLIKIESIITQYNLTNDSKDNFLKLKKEYNMNRNPLFLFILSCFSFSNYINFNEVGEFNSSFGKRRYNKNTKIRMINFLNKIKDYNFISNSFEKVDISILSSEDLVYIDPPYLITNNDYNKLWTDKEELSMFI
jgi:DNA adenine methylase